MSQVESPPPVAGTFPQTEEDITIRTKALEALLVEKGLVSTDAIDQVVSAYEKDIGPMLGAKVVARAWVDPAFKDLLLEDCNAACGQLGIGGMQGEHMRVLENTPQVHHVVVCTLCSCYPWPVLGLPPNWYKYPAYRSKMTREPRRALREDFGLDLDASVEVKVWDSSAEIRYWVLPERPAGTEGMDERELAGLVTREAMIGVAEVETPRGRR